MLKKTSQDEVMTRGTLVLGIDYTPLCRKSNMVLVVENANRDPSPSFFTVLSGDGIYSLSYSVDSTFRERRGQRERQAGGNSLAGAT